MKKQLISNPLAALVLSACWTAIFAVCLMGAIQQAYAAPALPDTDDLMHPPIQITSRTESVLDMAVSPDGRHIVYTSGEDNQLTLWLGSADPEKVLLPEKLASGPSVKSSPAISRDSRFIAYVDTAFDVKGDIYLMDRQMDDPVPVRLTGRSTEDGAPFFSNDGRFLYFHQATGNQGRGLVFMDLKKTDLEKLRSAGNAPNQPLPRPAAIMTGGNAANGALSPDNNSLAFVSTRRDASGDIFILTTRDSTLRQVTSGPAIDMFPSWHPDSRTLYFARIGSDTNHDGQLTAEDHAVICRLNIGVDIKTDGAIPFPVTPLDQISFKPFAADGRIYFLSDRAGVSNCWAIPEQGAVQTMNSAEAQLAAAQAIAGQIPYDPYAAILAYIRVVEKFSDNEKIAAKAGFETGQIYQDLNLPASALGAYQFVRTRYADLLPEAGLAAVHQVGIEFMQAAANATKDSEKTALREKSLGFLKDIAAAHPGTIAAEARLEKVRLLFAANAGLLEKTGALDQMEAVLSDPAATPAQKAHALFLKARIYETTGAGDQATDTLRSIITGYPDERYWVDQAVDHIIAQILDTRSAEDQTVSKKTSKNLSPEMTEKLQSLNLIAVTYRATAPPLALGALNRIGDIYYAAGDLSQAKTAYQNVLDAASALTTQTAAARLSLAEILYREERFREAIDLYEQEIRLRDAGDRIYQLARQGYIRKNISAGEFLYRLGEIPSARSLFKELMDYDSTIVPAHRGYIKCAAAAGDIESVLARYRQTLDAAPDNPVALYCTGLCLTYRNTADDAESAEKLILKALRYDSSVEYFHQTLGYVYEVQETVYNQSNRLEKALMAYQKAYFLNDSDIDPENAANLELNLGNSYYLLGQYNKAYEFYSRRQEREMPFPEVSTHLVFLKRFGECAFQINDMETTITLFSQARDQITTHMDPLAPTRAFDRLRQYIKDRIILAAGDLETTKPAADALALRQSKQNLRSAALADAAAAPPSEKWQIYKKNMERLIQDQTDVNQAAANLAAAFNAATENLPARRPISDARQNLNALTRQVQDALAFPERLVELQADISDRLGLAYQENQEFEKAAHIFEQVFSINEKSGNFQNLARNQRSVSYNTYLLAATATGRQRVRLLTKALEGFEQVRTLLQRHGVPEKQEKEKSGLIGISVSTSLDAAGATQAAHGFSEAQEKRLADTFISRIQLELGHLRDARRELDARVQEYVDLEKIAEADQYGVSLLHHRAGLMAYADKDPAEAFDRFADSARLCLGLANPVSTAQNLFNMAAAATALMVDSWPGRQVREFQELEQQAEALLTRTGDISGASLVLRFHNLMGVFYANAADACPVSVDVTAEAAQTPAKIETAVLKTLLEQQAFHHFMRGIANFKSQKSALTRQDLELGSALYLNLAALCHDLGDPDAAAQNFQNALQFSEMGVFPDIQWRARAGLGALENALEILSQVPLSRAGCLPGEITGAFSTLVFKQLAAGNAAAALDLAETISELERFHRLAPFVRARTRADKAFFADLFPRLTTLQSLEKELAAATPERRPFVRQRLENEQTLLAEFLGPDNENLPGPYRTIQDNTVRDLAIFLMALDQEIEKTAQDLAEINLKPARETSQTQDNQTLAQSQSQTQDLSRILKDQIHQYYQTCEDAFYDHPPGSPPDFITLLAPVPFDVMDLADTLTMDDAAARIVFSGFQQFPCAVFLITRDDETTGFIADTPKILKEKIADAVDWTTPYIATEFPFSTGLDNRFPFCLSAKHLERCITSRKPFKQNLMAIPDMAFPSSVIETYHLTDFNSPEKTEIDPDAGFQSLSDINTLVMARGPVRSTTVPVTPGEPARQIMAVYPDDNARASLETLLARAGSLSLAMVNTAKPADPADIFILGHVFAIFQCPSLIVTEQQDSNPAVDPAVYPAFTTDVLANYAEKSSLDALTAALQKHPGPELYPARYPVLYLGYQGMNKKEAAAFAKSNFIHYVKAGRTRFDHQDYAGAAVFFTHAITVANEIPAFDPYLPDLYKYGRESAYRAGRMDQALVFARELVSLYSDMAPDSRDHAEALLRLGLMHAKKNQYEKAIPAMEQAVTIMAEQPPDDDLVNAVAELGIVLENATSFHGALTRFKTAADLSKDLNRDTLLGEQFLHIGRVYDLRLNQYAMAITSYEKAVDIFKAADEVEKTAESQLNIGRCHRLLGNFTAAETCFDESLALITTRTPEATDMQAAILIEKANNAWFQGKYEQAFTFQRRSYTIAKQENLALMQVLCQNTEGLIWWTLGNYDKALSVLANALENARNLRIRKDEVASTLNNMGLIHRDMGNFETALETFDQAIEIDTAIGSQWGLAYDYRNKALTYLKLNQPEAAAALFDQAYKISTAIGNRINAAKAILGKGHALAALEQYEAAETAYKTARELSESMMIRETLWRALFGLAKLRIHPAGDPSAAESLLREALDIIEQLRSDIKVNQLRENFIANKLSVYETLVKLLADQNRPEAAFEIAERSRARNFIDLLGGQNIRFSSDQDEKWYQRQQILNSELDTAQKLLAAATPAEQEIYRKTVADLSHDLDNLMIDMQLKNPQLAAMVSVPPVEIDRLISYLDPGTVLLSYYLLDDEVLCWILQPERNTPESDQPENRLRLVRTPADRGALEQKILEYRRIIQNIEPYETHAEDLYATLMAPAAPYLADSHTVGICPHGALHYLSFATLKNNAGFVMDHHALFYVPSAAVLEYTLSRRTSRPYRSPRVLAVGNPDLGDPILDLPFAEQEVSSLQWNFPDITLLTRENATEAWVVNNIAGFDIIHIASHGEFDPVNPLLSAIKLSEAEDKTFTNPGLDGNLEAGEIFGLTVDADMVFLSACQTGLGKITAGDDVVGLNRSFFYAGTHTVISSLWRVSDVSTAILIKTFYRLYMNQNKADCLRQAALHVKSRYPHPGYWGAFTLVGDYY